MRGTGRYNLAQPKDEARLSQKAAVGQTQKRLDAIERMQSLPAELQEEIKRSVPHGGRSEASFRVTAKMLEQGLNDETIETIIRAHPKGIGEKYADRDDLAGCGKSGILGPDMGII